MGTQSSTLICYCSGIRNLQEPISETRRACNENSIKRSQCARLPVPSYVYFLRSCGPVSVGMSMEERHGFMGVCVFERVTHALSIRRIFRDQVARQ